MATRQHKASQPTGKPPRPEPGVATEPTWRQPPAETRARILRHQIAAERAQAARGNPLAPLISRALDVGQSMRLRHWLALFVLAAAGAAFTQLLSLDQFAVTASNVQVRGNQRLSVNEVYEASELDGQNLFQVQAQSVAQRVANLPGVDSARVRLRLPANVIIDMVELAPLATVKTITETLWIGTDGAGIQQVGDPPQLTLVEVSGTVRDAKGAVRPEIVTGLEAFRARQPALDNIYYGTLEGLYFRAPEGYTVYLGEGESVDQRLALLEATRGQITERGVHPQVIDLRFDGYGLLK
jgi:cell division septal protein FtsQ